MQRLDEVFRAFLMVVERQETNGVGPSLLVKVLMSTGSLPRDGLCKFATRELLRKLTECHLVTGTYGAALGWNQGRT